MLTYCEAHPRHYLESGVENNETQEEGKTETKKPQRSKPATQKEMAMRTWNCVEGRGTFPRI